MAPRKSKRERFPENGFEAWGGYMNAKMAKLEDQFLNEVEKEDWNRSNLFSGISIFVNGFTNPSADELKHIMAEHGGIYHHYFRSERTKFIIASNLPDTKVKNLPSTKIVKPEWISESIKAGTLLDYKEFLLYGNHSKTQPRLNFQSVKATPHTSSILPPAKEELSVTKEFHNDESIICNTNFNESAIGSSCIETVKETEIKCLSSAVKQNCLNLASNKVALCDEKDKYSSTRTAVDPKFLSEYYSNSRLHHISQLGAGFKQYINELRDASDFSFPLREKLKSPTFKCKDNKILAKKIIMHIDMDCFFVSVGLRKNPHLRGQPVAVTHSKGGGGKPHKRDGVDRKTEFYLYKAKRKSNMKKNLGDEYIQELEREFTTRVDGIEEENEKYGSMSEIASCSYEARALGVHNGMFMGPALRLCPNIQTIPYDFEGYKEVAFILYNTVAQYTLDIEAVSCDEMYVDCTDLLSDIGLTPMHFAKKLRDEIKKKTGCPCSTGFGSNRLQARLATKKAKPDGQFYLQEEDVLSYFSNVSLGDLPGVGRQMECKLTSLGFTNCESLRSTELAVLQKHFGNKTGQLLFNYCRGLDDKLLNFTILRKSISAGVNYGIRFEDFAQCENFLRQLSQELCSRMVQNKVIGKALTFKLMVRAAEAPVETAKFMGHGFCDNITKTTNLSQATDNIDIITKEVLDLCKKFDVKPEDMRGLSIQASKLENKDKCDEKKGGIQNFLQLKARFTESEFHKNNKDCVEIQPVKESDQKTFVSSQLIETFEDTCPLPKNNLSNEILTVLSNVNENISKPLIEKKPKSLGLTGKRRGRPPKNASLINNTKSVKNNSKTINLFLSSHANKNEKKAYNFEDLDQECLNALPDDLKTEILANCKIKEASNPTRNIHNSAPKTPVKNIAIDPDYLAALPEEIRKEIETNPEEFANPYIERKPQSNISNKPHASNIMVDDNILNHKKEIHNMEIESEKPETEKDILNLHWKDVREMLREWFKSTSLPMQCDIDMIMLYVKTLVMQKHIEDVDYLMKFFYRTMCDDLKDNCNWHRVYLDVIAGVQDAMLLVYKNKLKTDTTFSCCNF